MGLGIKLCGGHVKLEMPIRHSNERCYLASRSGNLEVR